MAVSEASQLFELEVVTESRLQAYVGEGQVICHENEIVNLSGNEPTVGNGYNSSLHNAAVQQLING
ncbi:MAG: hypothetical protein R2788_07040 [Saprospiraceae bacterium]